MRSPRSPVSTISVSGANLACASSTFSSNGFSALGSVARTRTTDPNALKPFEEKVLEAQAKLAPLTEMVETGERGERIAATPLAGKRHELGQVEQLRDQASEKLEEQKVAIAEILTRNKIGEKI